MFTSIGVHAQSKRLSIPERPNILMITCEDMSPILGAYGDSVAHTPNIDRLAKDGVKYLHMYSVSGVCAPSRAALATGMYPTSVGTHNMRTQYKTLVEGLPEYSVVLPEGVRHYAEILREHGYYTTNNVKTDYQFEGPFTAWDESSDSASYDGRAEGQPFFSIFNSTLTHESQVWRKENDSLLADPDEVPVPPYYPQNNAVIRKDIARVYSNVTEMDRWVGDLIARLEKDGLMDNIVIIFYSDHGGPLPRQKRELYDAGLHAPFIVCYPQRQLAGSIDSTLRSFIDIPASVLSLAGIKPPEYMHGVPFLGRYAEQEGREYIYAARDRMDSEYDRVRAVRDRRFKYLKNYFPNKPYVQEIEFRMQMDMMRELLRLSREGSLNEEQALWFSKSKPEEELYDTWSDPHELKNIAGDDQYDSVLTRMRNALHGWQLRYGDLGSVDEKELLHKMWGGKNTAPRTDAVEYRYDKKSKLLKLKSATPSASIGYQRGDDIGGTAWKLYKEPIKLSRGEKVLFKAQRIGYQESESRSFTVGHR